MLEYFSGISFVLKKIYFVQLILFNYFWRQLFW